LFIGYGTMHVKDFMKNSPFLLSPFLQIHKQSFFCDGTLLYE